MISSSTNPSNPPSQQPHSNSTEQPTAVSQYSCKENGGYPIAHSTTANTSSTPHKKKPQPVPDSLKDQSYWERRRRNNDSARRSRECRRQKEEQIAVRVVYLEQENLQLRTECSMLRAEIEKMRIMIYNQTTAAAAAAGHALKFD